MITILPSVTIVMILVSMPTVNSEDEDSCNKESKRMEITRRMTVDYAGSEREVNCIATVNVTECDGFCLSQVAPSARRASGIDKVVHGYFSFVINSHFVDFN